MSGWSLDYDDDIVVAAEYVLGLLTPAEQALVEERLAVDPPFRELVARWADDFATLTDDIPAITPPRALEGMLMRRLFGEEAAPERRRWSFWPALVSGALAAGLAAWLVVPGLLGPSEPEYAARIAAEDGTLVVEARFDADTRQLEVERTTGEAPEGQDLELWLVQGEEVRSLGVLPRDETGIIEVGAELASDFEGGALAVSVEPLGGSPTGQATGPIVAVGNVTNL